MNDRSSDPTGPDIVCLGTVEWFVIRGVAEYTMVGFARDSRVLFVEPFGSWITLARTARWQRRKRESKPRLEQVAPNMWVYRPKSIGVPGISRFRWVADANGWILAFMLRGVLRRLGFQRPVVWSYLYNTAALLRALPARLRIYECIDNDAALARSDRQRRLVAAHEAATCQAADLVFAVTDELAVLLSAHTGKVKVVNCAGALAFFGQALHPGTIVPEDLARLPHPVIGYMGGVDPWKIDVGLLSAMARAHPEWSIVLVGYVWFGFDVGQFEACPNIHVLGAKDYEQFPAYLKGMDVCIIPFPLNDNTLMGDALKLYEYLASGRPVVSTPVPAARRLSSVVRIAETTEAFIAATEAALTDPPDRLEARLAAIQPHSWEARNRQKADYIDQALSELPQ